jgi:hypothetical protein
MFVSEVETIYMLSTAVRQAATALRIINVMWKSGEELLEDIQERDQKTYDVLREFLHAYTDWFRFQKTSEEQGRSGYLDGSQFDELTQLVGNRNRARDELLARLTSLA